MKTLKLTIKKKWFDKIKSGEKKEEYREIKSYWIKRLFYTTLEDGLCDYIWFDVAKALRNPQKHGYSDTDDVLFSYGLEPIEYDFVEFYNGGHFSKDVPHFKAIFNGVKIGTPIFEQSESIDLCFKIQLGGIL